MPAQKPVKTVYGRRAQRRASAARAPSPASDDDDELLLRPSKAKVDMNEPSKAMDMTTPSSSRKRQAAEVSPASVKKLKSSSIVTSPARGTGTSNGRALEKAPLQQSSELVTPPSKKGKAKQVGLEDEPEIDSVIDTPSVRLRRSSRRSGTTNDLSHVDTINGSDSSVPAKRLAPSDLDVSPPAKKRMLSSSIPDSPSTSHIMERPTTPPPTNVALPVTPRASGPPRDLSALFNSLPPSPAPSKSPANHGLVRSMSKRSPSKLFGQYSGTDSPSPRMSTVLSSFPGHESPLRRLHSAPEPSVQAPQEENPVQPIARTMSQTSAQRTYAKSRSYLMEIHPSQSQSQSQSHSQSVFESQSTQLDESQPDGLIGDMDLGVPALPDADFDVEEIRESYADKIKRWGLESDDGADDGLADPADLRSITFLRSKGESRRLTDELNYLLDGLKPERSMQIKRSSAMEIVEKMLDEEYVRKLKALGMLGETWDVLRKAGAGEGDHILDALLALFLAIVTTEVRNFDPLLARVDDVMTVLEKMMQTKGDSDVLLQTAKVSKSERSSVAAVRDLIARSNLDIEASQMSIRRLVSTSLGAFAEARPTPLTLAILSPTCLALLDELERFSIRLHAYATTEVALLPDEKDVAHSVNLDHASNCLQVIECLTLAGLKTHNSREALELLKPHAKQLGENLSEFCMACYILAEEEEGKATSSATECLISALRVMVNLSGSDADWCQSLLDASSTTTMIMRLIVDSQREDTAGDSAEPLESARLDLLCLALALLTNMVEQVPAARHRFRETLFHEGCKGDRSCVLGCKCAKRGSALRLLTRLYVAQASRSEDSPEAAFVSGHTAVLLGLLSTDAAESQNIILECLPGTTKQEKLNQLLASVKDFAGMQKSVREKLKNGPSRVASQDEPAEAEPAFSNGREEVVAAQLDAEEKSKQVLDGVIDLLESLRDPS